MALTAILVTEVSPKCRRETMVQDHANPSTVIGVDGTPNAKPTRQDNNDAITLERARKALADAVTTSAALWITFLTFATYLAIAVGSVTHRQLFLAEPVRLPLLNVDLPLVSFFLISPILLLIFHIYLVTNLKLTADNVRLYRSLMDRSSFSDLEKDGLLLELPNFTLVQILSPPRFNSRGVSRCLMLSIMWISLLIAPILIMLMIQIQFLPYHHSGVTWAHRAVLGIDLAMLWIVWPRVMEAPWRARAELFKPAVAFALTCVVLAFSMFVATYPAEAINRSSLAQAMQVPRGPDPLAPAVPPGIRAPWRWTPLHDLLFAGMIDDFTGKRKSLWSDTLILSDQDFVDFDRLKEVGEALVTLDWTEPWQAERVKSFRRRDLQGAVFARADLRFADFSGADLTDADFTDALLDGALFGCRNSERPDPTRRSAAEPAERPSILGSSEECTRMEGAILESVRATGASFEGALLQHARMTNGQFERAIFDEASLQFSQLQFADLSGASLWNARLQKVQLQGATMKGADLSSANLIAADMQGVDLSGATVEHAQLVGADLTRTTLLGSSLVGARLQGARLEGAEFDGVDVSGASFWRTQREGIKLRRTYMDDKSVDGELYASWAENDYTRTAELGVKSENELQIIRDRLEVMLTPMSDEQVAIEKRFFDLVSNESQSARDYYDHLLILLNYVACTSEGAQFVIYGIVVRLDDYFEDEEYLDVRRVESVLLDTGKCVGAAKIWPADREFMITAMKQYAQMTEWERANASDLGAEVVPVPTVSSSR